ncbi:MAG TPA: hypothetical protein VFB60_22960 [Ktedonobacteraceae bacterium]|nr:hypothetical protein [Ktedonobacteraceae bacterium]
MTRRIVTGSRACRSAWLVTAFGLIHGPPPTTLALPWAARRPFSTRWARKRL